jgi:hypothetical protein
MTFRRQPVRHEMVMCERRSSGAEEWWCPSCGRRLVVRWPPDYERVVLDPGDPYAIHVGGAPGEPPGPVTPVTPVTPAAEPGQKWLAWLHDNGIEWESPAA